MKYIIVRSDRTLSDPRMLLWFISLYPIKQTCEALKKVKEDEKANEDISHWCTYWLIYALCMQHDYILSYVPFWSMICPIVLMLAYNPTYTKMIYDGSIQLLQYKILILNKSFNLQKHLDFVANKYMIPCLDFMEANLASRLPSPLSDILIKFSQVLHSIFIVVPSKEDRGTREGPYKVSDPMMKTD